MNYCNLRVTVLSLDGIHLSPRALAPDSNTFLPSVSPNLRITVWVGFWPSFPPESIAVPSSNYCTLFEREGGLLAVESEPVDVTKNINNDNTKHDNAGGSDWTGVACWINRAANIQEMEQNAVINEEDADHRPEKSQHMPHLQIQASSSSPKDEHEIEIHVCVCCMLVDPRADFVDVDAEAKTQCNNRAVNDDADSDSFDEGALYGNDRHLSFGIAKLKLPHSNLESGSSNESGEVVHLPVTLSRSKCTGKASKNQSNRIVGLTDNATISLFVDRTPLAETSTSDENNSQLSKIINQRQFVGCSWREGNVGPHDFAPPSITPHDEVESSNSRENDKENITESTSKPWFPRASTTMISKNVANLFHKRGSDANKQAQLPTSISFQIGKDPEEGSDDVANPSLAEDYDSNQGGSKGFEQTPMDDKNQGVHDNYMLHRMSERMNDVALNVGSSQLRSSHGSQLRKSIPQRIRERMMCGAQLEDFGEALKSLAEAAHHCDEDHVDIYVMDSTSVGTSIATNELAFL